MPNPKDDLPPGYQFGDAAGGPGSVRLFYDSYARRMIRIAFPIDGRDRPVSRPDPEYDWLRES